MMYGPPVKQTKDEEGKSEEEIKIEPIFIEKIEEDEKPKHFYSHAKFEKAKKYAGRRELRTKRKEDRVEPLDFESDGMKVWLRENTLRGPVETPSRLKELVGTLELALGNPQAPIKKDSNDFARVCTVRIKSGTSTSGPVRRTSYKFSERYDYTLQQEEHRPIVSSTCAGIVKEFLKITGYDRFVQTILDKDGQTKDGKRVYAHVDWYPKRTYQAQTWHKDTRGVTLFVGLIYMNDGAIQGPDVIPNPWPLSEEMESKRLLKCRLPKWIKDPIDEILVENAKAGKMQICQTPMVPEGGGMVWFIDELIHHRTPQGKSISFDDKTHEPKGLALYMSEKNLGDLPFDGLSYEGEWNYVFRGDGGRKFVRIWVALDEPMDL